MSIRLQDGGPKSNLFVTFCSGPKWLSPRRYRYSLAWKVWLAGWLDMLLVHMPCRRAVREGVKAFERDEGRA